MEQEYVKKTIDQAFFLLPERQKEAITLVYYNGCTGQEASEIMGLTVSALESLLVRGRRNLKRHLEKQQADVTEVIHGHK
ncbi:MAG: hypothetical protein CMH32_06885 [Micavibrio sp.]|nr:hypothetical protein [Micavibrio sp.]